MSIFGLCRRNRCLNNPHSLITKRTGLPVREPFVGESDGRTSATLPAATGSRSLYTRTYCIEISRAYCRRNFRIWQRYVSENENVFDLLVLPRPRELTFGIVIYNSATELRLEILLKRIFARSGNSFDNKHARFQCNTFLYRGI